MSKLYELIKELCPNGVEYKTLGEVITRYTEKSKNDKSVKTVYAVSKDDGLIPSLDYWSKNTSEKRIDYQIYSDDVSNYNIIRKNMFAYNPARLNIGSISCLFDKEDGLLSPMYVVFKIDEKLLLPKYVLIFLKSERIIAKIDSMKEEGVRFRFDFKNWNKIQIPVPPLPVQEEIVRILDKFTSLTAELTAELTARRKQYEYYRDALLTRDTKIEQTTLDKISENCDSQRKPVTSGNRIKGDYPYYGASGIVDYVNDYIFDGDYLLVSEDGANLVARSTPIAFSISGKNWVNNHAHILKFKESATRKFVEHYLNSINLEKYISGGAQPKLNQQNLNKIPIPLPPLSVQQRIVNVLDNFDAICSDLKIGLPAEIEARKKQYEYYRDLLLTFAERGNTIFADSRQQTADSRQQTADSRQQTADSRQQTADSRQQTADSRQQTADSR